MTDPFAASVAERRGLLRAWAYDMKAEASPPACSRPPRPAARGLRGDVILDRRLRRGVRERRDRGDRGVVRRADAAIVTEPTELQARGRATAASSTSRSRSTGRAAHGSRPHLGHRRDREDGPRPRRHRGARPPACARTRRTRSSEVEASTRSLDRGRSGVLELPGSLSAARLSAGRSRASRSRSSEQELQRDRRRAGARRSDFSARGLRASHLARAVRGRPKTSGDRRQAASPARCGRDRHGAGHRRRVRTGADSALPRERRHSDRALPALRARAHAEVEWVDVASLEQCVRSTSLSPSDLAPRRAEEVRRSASAVSLEGVPEAVECSPRDDRRPPAGRRARRGVRRVGGRTGRRTKRSPEVLQQRSGRADVLEAGGCATPSPP